MARNRRFSLSCYNKHCPILLRPRPDEKVQQGMTGVFLRHAVQIEARFDVDISAGKFLAGAPVEAGHGALYGRRGGWQGAARCRPRRPGRRAGVVPGGMPRFHAGLAGIGGGVALPQRLDGRLDLIPQVHVGHSTCLGGRLSGS
jgi:hypothetical protein